MSSNRDDKHGSSNSSETDGKPSLGKKRKRAFQYNNNNKEEEPIMDPTEEEPPLKRVALSDSDSSKEQKEENGMKLPNNKVMITNIINQSPSSILLQDKPKEIMMYDSQILQKLEENDVEQLQEDAKQTEPERISLSSNIHLVSPIPVKTQIQNDSILSSSKVQPAVESTSYISRDISESTSVSFRNEGLAKNVHVVKSESPFPKNSSHENFDDTMVKKEKCSFSTTNEKDTPKNDDPIDVELKKSSQPTKRFRNESSSFWNQDVKLYIIFLFMLGSRLYLDRSPVVETLTVTRLSPHVRPPQKFKESGTVLNPKSLLKSVVEDFVNIDTSFEENEAKEPELSNVSLRQYLSHPAGFHLAMAPAFFGFYAYFGALIAFNEEVLTVDDELTQEGFTILPSKQTENFDRNKCLLKSAVGASAGAMAAVLLATGRNPRLAAEFASSLTLSSFADPPGIGGALKGDLFEALMLERTNHIHLENALIPVAVSAFDLATMSGRILSSGCMARAARASATFPGLFQPVLWNDEINHDRNVTRRKEANQASGLFAFLNDFSLPPILIDGGVTDTSGYLGLSAILPDSMGKRVVNLVVGDFHMGNIPGPSMLRSQGIQAAEVVSITLENSPRCAPWAMENGPIAVQAVRQAVTAVLDFPMYLGNEPGHYILHIDTSDFIPPAK